MTRNNRWRAEPSNGGSRDAGSDAAQRLVALLRGRLARARMLLGRQLVSSYERDKPDLVSVVLQSSGFQNPLNQLTYLHDAQQQQQTIISYTKTAKAQAGAC